MQSTEKVQTFNAKIKESLMKAFTFYFIPLLMLPQVYSITHAQDKSSNRIVLLPFQSIGMDETTVQASESILRYEIEKRSSMDLSPEDDTKKLSECDAFTDMSCAIEIGKRLNAEQVIACILIALGDKIIVKFRLVDVTSEKILFTDEITSMFIEDLNVVMKRMAKSIVEYKSVDAGAEIGIITEEEAMTPLRRGAHRFSGFSFGYLYPQNGYNRIDRAFTFDFRTGAEFDDFSVGMQLALRKGFAANVFSSYLFSKTDLCPYIGGALGFHWISHDECDEDGYCADNGKRSDGFEWIINAGLRIFHTYNIKIIVNLSYALTLNDFDDRAFILTVGLLR
jgi:hypothetical protein